MKFSMILEMKMEAETDEYLASVTDKRDEVVFGLRIDKKVRIDYMNVNGKLRTIDFVVAVELRKMTQLVLSVGDEIILFVNCQRPIRKPVPVDLPQELELTGATSIGRKGWKQV